MDPGPRRSSKVAKASASALTIFVLLSYMSGAVANDTTANAEISGDVQCMLVGARLADSPNQKLVGDMLLVYFLGRINGRFPGIDLEKRVVREAARMTESDYKSAAGRCGRQFSAQGAQITQIGRALERSKK